MEAKEAKAGKLEEEAKVESLKAVRNPNQQRCELGNIHFVLFEIDLTVDMILIIHSQTKKPSPSPSNAPPTSRPSTKAPAGGDTTGPTPGRTERPSVSSVSAPLFFVCSASLIKLNDGA